MTPDEYKRAIKTLGLSKDEAGRFLVDNPRTARRWMAGENRIPKSVAMLLRLMVKLRLCSIEVEYPSK